MQQAKVEGALVNEKKSPPSRLIALTLMLFLLSWQTVIGTGSVSPENTYAGC